MMNSTTSTPDNSSTAAPPIASGSEFNVIHPDDMFRFRLTMYTAIIPITALIGLVGNAISSVVLFRFKMRKSTKILLLTLTFCDFIHLIAMVLFCFVGITIAVKYKPGLYAAREAFPYFGSFLRHIFGRVSNLIIVLVSLERMVAVLFPLKIKALSSPRVVGALIFVCSVGVFIILLPYALEFQPKYTTSENSSAVVVTLELTAIGKNREIYSSLYLVRLSVLRIIPLIFVLISNIAITVSLYRSRSARRDMTGKSADATGSEAKITRTLLGLTFLFFFCLSPYAVMILSQLFDTEYNFPQTRNNVYNFAGVLFIWFEAINSSADFIVYICSSKQMREEFRGIFRKRVDLRDDLGLQSIDTLTSGVRATSEVSMQSHM